MKCTRSVVMCLAVFALAGCDGDPSMGPADADRRDAGAITDAGVGVDASAVDGGSSDGGPPDAGSTLDAGGEDAGGGDAGADDSGTLDAGALDAGTPDPDSGPECAPFETVASPPSAPPFMGTAFITDDLLTDADPTSFVDVTYTGQGTRTMFDRRPAAFVDLNAHLFDARFGTTVTIEIQVNPEFSRAQAETEARYYAAAIGRLPGFLFRDIDTVWIHAGMEAFGGRNRNLLIHTQQGEFYAGRGSLEEILLHEATHTSMDAYHVEAPRWVEAAAADGVALSTYARDNPLREEVAETVGPYLAARFGGSRISEDLRAQILGAIPNRVRYLDCLGLTMAPVP